MGSGGKKSIGLYGETKLWMGNAVTVGSRENRPRQKKAFLHESLEGFFPELSHFLLVHFNCLEE